MDKGTARAGEPFFHVELPPKDAQPAPHAGDFVAFLDCQLHELRGSLVREHDRTARLREDSLRGEVARLRQELAALGGASAWRSRMAAASEGLKAGARGLAGEATVLDARPDVSDIAGMVGEAAPRVSRDSTHRAPTPQAPPPAMRTLDPDPDRAQQDRCDRQEMPAEATWEVLLSVPSRRTSDLGDVGNGHRISEVFSRLDRNHDGVLSQQETTNMRRSSHTTGCSASRNHGGSLRGSDVAQANALKMQLVREVVLATQELTAMEAQLPTPKRMEGLSYDRIDKFFLNPIMCGVVSVNCVTIGIATDLQANSIGWMLMDLGFVIIYIAELVLKIWVLGIRGFLRGREWGWNLFDSLIIVLALVDLSVSFTFHAQDMASSAPSLIFARLMRITRVGRILRLFQFEVFKELLTMLNGLISALRTLVWAFVLLFFPIYTLGLLLTSLVGQAGDASPTAKDAFGRLAPSMFMVFRCVTGDCTLANGTPVMMMLTNEFGWVYGVVYVLVIMLVTFGIFNLIMATFVDSALSTARRNESIRMRSRLNDRKREKALTSQLVYKLLKCHKRELPEEESLHLDDFEEVVYTTISKEVFEKAMSDEEAQHLLEELDVPEGDRTGLFDVLDADGGGTLQLDEIIGGLIKLRGDPRRSDVIHVGLVLHILQEQVARLEEGIHAQVQTLKDEVGMMLELKQCDAPVEAMVVQRM